MFRKEVRNDFGLWFVYQRKMLHGEKKWGGISSLNVYLLYFAFGEMINSAKVLYNTRKSQQTIQITYHMTNS